MTNNEDRYKVPEGITTSQLGRRYAARTIDSIVVFGLAMILFIPISVLAATGSPLVAGAAGTISVVSIQILYGSLLEASAWQATLGKKWLGLRVYNAEGGRLTLPQSFVRTAIKDLPFILLALLPAGQLLSIGWLVCHVAAVQMSPVSQAIHDRFARTWVGAPEEAIQLHLS